MNKYELGVIFRPSLEEDALKTELEKVQELITRFGGTIEKVDSWGKRRLAYEIQKLTEGFYYFITFESQGGVPAEIEQRIRIFDNVIRYLVIRQEV
ncbi:MAG: 30S ribosomal protein S6 [Clostridiales bacterium]|jgi:small subunit ribosomal protein S6|nr:30S ribosomal protein S6 [Clostridiales bacterium]MDR2752191.1 30S ribosomal protein S6 [Clostridiales bacterium]